MEKFQSARNEALTKIKAADHMLTQTYNSLKDTRILVSVLTNLWEGAENAMEAILHYDRAFHKIPPFHDNFGSKLLLFKNTSASIHSLQNFVPFLNQVNEIFEGHKNSPVEFSRQDSFVICDDSYRMKIVTAKDLKGFIDEAKRFYTEAAKITSENEDIFEMRMKDA